MSTDFGGDSSDVFHLDSVQTVRQTNKQTDKQKCDWMPYPTLAAIQ